MKSVFYYSSYMEQKWRIASWEAHPRGLNNSERLWMIEHDPETQRIIFQQFMDIKGEESEYRNNSFTIVA